MVNYFDVACEWTEFCHFKGRKSDIFVINAIWHFFDILLCVLEINKLVYFANFAML